jgi:drug/metabolite transporter (DMT)-like permease
VVFNTAMALDRTYRPLRGALWMLLTGLLFVGVTALVKYLGPEVPAAQAAFLRYALGLVFLIPMLPALWRAPVTRRDHALFAARGLGHSLAVALWFFAMARIPIADVTAMNYLAPIYVTLGAALFLGEKLALRRVLAIVVALIGALIVLRPGFREIGPGHYAMLGAAVVFGGSYLLAKVLTDRNSATVVVAQLSVWVTLGLLPMAVPVWETPSLHTLAVLFAVAALATAGHYTMTLAFASATVTVTQPVTFLQLLWAVSLGALVFNEPVDPWVVMGGLVILGSVTYITWREAMLKRRITPDAPAVKL